VTRAFVAVRPPDGVLDAVEALVGALDVPDARWTDRDQWHVTLQFLGNRADVDAVAAALAPLAVHAGNVRFGGVGAFPTPRRARVVWLGVATGEPLLAQLAACVAVLLRPLGFEPEGRAYHPHLTLARCKTPTDVRAATDAFATAEVGAPWTAGEVVVYESTRGRAGARYTPRATLTLPR